MQRNISFDYIRSFSVIAIVLCHCCMGIDGMQFLGTFLGCTFNVVFLTLSAFLLGLSWEYRGCNAYGPDFLKHRISKLLYVYYPFLVLMFGFLAFMESPFSIKDITMHLCLLPWFDKLPGFGHLWFITMITICYICVLVTSRITSIKTKKFIALLVIGGIISQVALGIVGLPNYLFIYLFLYIMVFTHAKKIIDIANNVKILPITIVTVLSFGLVIALFYFDVLNKYTSVWGGLLCAILFFLFMNRMFQNAKQNKIISFISMISFEIYLIHHVFCVGKWSLFRIIENPFIGIFVVALLSTSLAYILHLISKMIKKIKPKNAL